VVNFSPVKQVIIKDRWYKPTAGERRPLADAKLTKP
jgi:hypothetical protein